LLNGSYDTNSALLNVLISFNETVACPRTGKHTNAAVMIMTAEMIPHRNR